jgi:hypothetical protein
VPAAAASSKANQCLPGSSFSVASVILSLGLTIIANPRGFELIILLTFTTPPLMNLNVLVSFGLSLLMAPTTTGTSHETCYA